MQAQVIIPTLFLDEFCTRWKILELALFGSAVRADFGPESDVDVLVRFQPDAEWDLWHLIEMRDELSHVLGREVDLVEEDGLRNPIRRAEILNSKVKIFERG